MQPVVLEVMREVGIDLSGRTPQVLTPELAATADVLVTMGCGDQCPVIPGKRYIDWDLTDPKDQAVEQVRATRELIAQRVRVLLTSLDASG